MDYDKQREVLRKILLKRNELACDYADRIEIIESQVDSGSIDSSLADEVADCHAHKLACTALENVISEIRPYFSSLFDITLKDIKFNHENIAGYHPEVAETMGKYTAMCLEEDDTLKEIETDHKEREEAASKIDLLAPTIESFFTVSFKVTESGTIGVDASFGEMDITLLPKTFPPAEGTKADANCRFAKKLLLSRKYTSQADLIEDLSTAMWYGVSGVFSRELSPNGVTLKEAFPFLKKHLPSNKK